jgi:SAM-dependent methyltransferase
MIEANQEIFEALKQTYYSKETHLDVIEKYWKEHFKRIVYTFNFIGVNEGDCLELGSTPYFMTMLLKKYSKLNITLANFHDPKKHGDAIPFDIISNGDIWKTQFYNFNVERDTFPFADCSFDLVLFCEMIEHLQNDPVFALGEIWRVLKPDGTLILTTPNINKIQNIQKLLQGMNIYENYSIYGPYGRHNREYCMDELRRLLVYCNFRIKEIFTQNVYEERFNYKNDLINALYKPGTEYGQIIFVKAQKNKIQEVPKPDFLR